MDTAGSPDDLSFLSDGGEMGRLMRVHDWSRSAVGSPATWPHSLRMVIRLMLNARHPMYVFWGPESVCFYNDAYARSLGPEQHPVSLGMPAQEAWQGVWELIGPQIDQVKAGLGATWHENQLVPIRRNGVTEDAYWTYSFGPLHDDTAESGIGGVLVVCTETTRQVDLAQRLAASTERLNQALSAGGGVGTWDWDVVADRVFADARFARLYGVDPEKAQAGAPLADFFTAVHPADRPILQSRIDAALRGTGVFNAEYRLVDSSGQISWVVAEGQGEFDAEGRAIRLAGVSIDITDRKKAEAQLRVSEAHHRLVLSALHEGIVVTDTHGRVISCNRAAERIIGVTSAEWRGGNAIAPGWQPLRHDGSPMPIEELPPGRVLAGMGPQLDVEVRCLDRDGRPAVFQVSAVPVNSEDTGDLLAVVTMFIDVTVRQRADEERLRHRQGLEALVAERTGDLEMLNRALHESNQALAASRDEAYQATRAKSAFLANMSHEIRTPMNAILGLTHILSRSDLDAEQRVRLGEVSAAARHLLGLINDVLDLSKIEAGVMVLDKADFATAQLVESVVGMVGERAKAKGLELVVEMSDMPRFLRGDRLKLSQILINLLSNAVKFTQTGTIHLRGSVVHDAGDSVCLQFEVQDTGPGIAPEHQALLFKAFGQADNSSTRRHGGTGLGLALSRELARKMGGDATLISEVGAGSTFRITAWLEHGDQANAFADSQRSEAKSRGAAEELLRQRHGGRRVLLAEDHPINRMVAEGLLRSAGLVVTSVSDGIQAVAMVAEAPYDLILMDMQMPDMDGLQATREIRGAGHAVPIIAMTANAFLEGKMACLSAGMDDYVVKPVDPEVLYSVLLRWLSAGAPQQQKRRAEI